MPQPIPRKHEPDRRERDAREIHERLLVEECFADDWDGAEPGDRDVGRPVEEHPTVRHVPLVVEERGERETEQVQADADDNLVGPELHGEERASVANTSPRHGASEAAREPAVELLGGGEPKNTPTIIMPSRPTFSTPLRSDSSSPLAANSSGTVATTEATRKAVSKVPIRGRRLPA